MESEEWRLLDYPADHGDRGTEIIGLSSRSWKARSEDYWTIQQIIESEERRLLDYPADHGERGTEITDYLANHGERGTEITGLSSGSWRARNGDNWTFQWIIESEERRLLDYPTDHGERGTEITGLSSRSWRARNGDY
jgi:hypothetical protein